MNGMRKPAKKTPLLIALALTACLAGCDPNSTAGKNAPPPGEGGFYANLTPDMRFSEMSEARNWWIALGGNLLKDTNVYRGEGIDVSLGVLFEETGEFGYVEYDGRPNYIDENMLHAYAQIIDQLSEDIGPADSSVLYYGGELTVPDAFLKRNAVALTVWNTPKYKAYLALGYDDDRTSVAVTGRLVSADAQSPYYQLPETQLENAQTLAEYAAANPKKESPRAMRNYDETVHGQPVKLITAARGLLDGGSTYLSLGILCEDINALGATLTLSLECTDPQGEKAIRLINVMPAAFSDSEPLQESMREIARGESDRLYGDIELGYDSVYANAASMRIRLFQVNYLARGAFTYSEQESPWLDVPLLVD